MLSKDDSNRILVYKSIIGHNSIDIINNSDSTLNSNIDIIS